MKTTAKQGEAMERTEEMWWRWHDADASMWSGGEDPEEATREAEARCAAWVRGESHDGPAPMATETKMTEAQQQEAKFQAFVEGLVEADRKGCEAAGAEMDATWTGEHTTALADFLGCRVAELDEGDIQAAKVLYRKAAR
jgi:hypothetical protein